MNYQRKLIKFMRAKANYIKKFTNIPYFTAEDAKAIRTWSNKDAKAIWVALLKYAPIACALCPFCLYHFDKHKTNCSDCDYGKNHGLCDDITSDYKAIKTVLSTVNKEILTPEVHTQIINNIEYGDSI